MTITDLVKKIKDYFYLSPPSPTYKETLEETSKFLNMSKNLLIKKINEGAKAEFIVHRNTPDFFRKLGKERKAKVYYTPQELQGTYHIFDNKDYLFFRTGQGVASGQNKEFIKNLREDMDKKIVKYLIPPDKIDKIFDMIQNGIKSELIAKELGYKFP